MDKYLLVISCGEVLGISYELVLKISKFLENNRFLIPVLVGNLKWLKYVSKKINTGLSFLVVNEEILATTQKLVLPKQKCLLIDVLPNYDIFTLKRNSGEVSICTLEKTVDLIHLFIKFKKKFCLLTMPVSKKNIQKYNKNFVGHTEFFAKKFDISLYNVSMLMEGEDKDRNLYRVLMLTRHIPLKDVVKNLDVEKSVVQIKNVVNFIDKYEKIKVNNIFLCGVNPHNGDNGAIGKEEITVFPEIVKKLKSTLYNKKIFYPYSAADAFNYVRCKKDSLIVCIYHDQAMLPLKLLCGYKITNITVGLPFLRVSPGHGTAENIMFKNSADLSGVKFCIEKLQEFLNNVKEKY